MATANEIIAGALRKAGIVAAESPITDAEFADGLELMNDKFSELEESVMSLGFQPVPKGSDEVRIPRGAVGFAKAFLAMKMVTEYRTTMPIGLPDEVREATNNVLIANRQDMASSFPSTLPKGSGNDDGGISSVDRFYTQDDKVNY